MGERFEEEGEGKGDKKNDSRESIRLRILYIWL